MAETPWSDQIKRCRRNTAFLRVLLWRKHEEIVETWGKLQICQWGEVKKASILTVTFEYITDVGAAAILSHEKNTMTQLDGANGPFSFAPVLHELMVMNNANMCKQFLDRINQNNFFEPEGLRTAAFIIDMSWYVLKCIHLLACQPPTHTHTPTHPHTHTRGDYPKHVKV